MRTAVCMSEVVAPPIRTGMRDPRRSSSSQTCAISSRKRAVAALTPYIEQSAGQSHSAGKVLIATVKGDVHDIGKNIVSVVMAARPHRGGGRG